MGLGQMKDLWISGLNQLYSNLSSGIQENGTWRFRVFESGEGRSFREQLGNCIRHESMNLEVLKDLKISLQVTLSYQRVLISRHPYEFFWEEHLRELEKRFSLSKNFIDSSLKMAIEGVFNVIENSAGDITTLLTHVVEDEIRRSSGRCLIVPETPKLGHLYQDWADQMRSEMDVSILKNKSDISSLAFEDYNLILFPGSPSRYLARQFFDTYLRSLLLSGISKQVSFVSPSWAFTKADLDLSETLLPGLKIVSLPVFDLVTEKEVEISTEGLSIEPWEMDVSYSSNQSYEQFEPGGSIPCRLIGLGNNLVYPIEDDAKRVTVLVKDVEKGIWEIDFKDPYSELGVDDFLIACVSRSETQDLRERAARKMAGNYEKFMTCQMEWKRKLNHLFAESSTKTVELALLKAGVSKANRARYWISPDAIQPASRTDFIALLKYLGFENLEIEQIIKLANEYDALLISEGREASKAIANALDEFEFSKLDRGESLEITLDEFGDATYLVSANQGILSDELYCRPSQVRKVIEYSNELGLL